MPKKSLILTIAGLILTILLGGLIIYSIKYARDPEPKAVDMSALLIDVAFVDADGSTKHQKVPMAQMFNTWTQAMSDKIGELERRIIALEAKN